jgi:hypothetical protein
MQTSDERRRGARRAEALRAASVTRARDDLEAGRGRIARGAEGARRGARRAPRRRDVAAYSRAKRERWVATSIATSRPRRHRSDPRHASPVRAQARSAEHVLERGVRAKQRGWGPPQPSAPGIDHGGLMGIIDHRRSGSAEGLKSPYRRGSRAQPRGSCPRCIWDITSWHLAAATTRATEQPTASRSPKTSHRCPLGCARRARRAHSPKPRNDAGAPRGSRRDLDDEPHPWDTRG